MLQAIVFDFDGTILDTETPEYETWQETYRGHGVELPLAEWVRCVGGGSELFNPYDYLEELAGCPVDRDEIRAVRRQRFLDRVQAQPVMPGVLALMDAAEEQGLKLAVASSSTRDWVESNLQRLGLRARFGAVLTAADVARVKPDPALYQMAAEALGVAPARALAIEDSYNGLLGAKGAGLSCVVVPNAITRQLDFAQADLCLASLDSLPPAELLARFAPRASQEAA